MAESAEDPSLFPRTVGEKLREARVAQGLDLGDIAARTRIPLRHLEAIEKSQFSGLPSVTYATGFVKGYARAVGLDEVALARDLRHELDTSYERAPPRPVYELEDPKHVPSRGFAIGVALVVIVAVLVIGGFWYRSTLFGGSDTAVATAPQAAPSAAAPVPAASPIVPASGGQVTLTATEEVWVRVYDGTGKTLFERTLKPAERYDVPQDANKPMINIGRPDKVQVTINGSLVAPLGTGERAIKDVGISADALRARTATTPAGGTSGNTTATP